MSFNHRNGLLCTQCGCMKSNHGYWRPKGRGYVSRPCRLHDCPEYKEPHVY